MTHLLTPPRAFPACCAGVGYFDGFHRGHMALVRNLVAEAKRRGRRSALVSLYDPPGAVLTTEEEKAALLEGTGLDLLLSLPAAPGLSRAEQRALAISALPEIRCFVSAVPEERLPEGVDGVFCPLVTAGGEPVSTARLSAALDRGDMEEYTALCGHPYSVRGPIVHGRQLGRTVGMPTANLRLPPRKRLPAAGVYATLSAIAGGWHMGLTNVGRRPTVDDSGVVTVETHLLDLDCDLYGEMETLEFHIYIRGVKKFDSLAQVRAQVDRDTLCVRDRLSELLERRRAGQA